MRENQARQTEFNHQRQLNEENTIGVVNADLGEEYGTALVELDQLEELIEHAREQLDTNRVFIHCADDSPVLISLWSDAHAAIGLSPIVSEEKAAHIRGDDDDE